MSQLLIQHYLNELQTLRRVSGTARESVVSEAFKTLLKDWGKSRDLFFIPQYEYQTLQKKPVYPDGALVYELRVPLGYWEAKDEEDDLDKEIEKKFRKGYPQDNIIFEDSHEAILIQNRREVIRCGVQDPAKLQKLLELFFGYEREEIADFRKAVKQFKTDLPQVLSALRDMIGAAERDNDSFRKAAILFLKHAQETINPSVTTADVREMLIQHILTEEIFSQVFDDSNFHRQNNIAKELYALENTFFTGKVKHDTLSGLRPYYAAIKSAAALVTGHHEKQKFLKTIYENFYKVYDKKKADRLGVVYTPNEIVRFMIESADWLCQKHFNKPLIDKNVEILDPAAGTGTFITELIEHFRGQRQKLRHKYLEELHANEVAILPYYVANLNIEATYTAINGFEVYPNLCFVDTLDNTAALKALKGQHVGDLFGAVSKENVARIKRQNAKKISVIIGNPPYNAWQENFNLQNPNRPYRLVDDHIRATYVREGTAQNQSGVYDMYTRFYRWASDRLADDGIVAFISNRSYIDSRIMDGFRRVVGREFSEIRVVDLGADIRANPKLSGTKHNVFGIQTGVAIGFFVKHKSRSKPARIFYSRRPEFETAVEKLVFISETALQSMDFDEITPDKKCNWIGVEQNDFDELIPMFDPLTARKRSAQARTLFRRFSMGIQPKCDNWIYDKEASNLRRKMEFFTRAFNDAVTKNNFPNDKLKWHRELVKLAKKQEKTNIRLGFDPQRIICSLYRPYSQEYFYNDRFIISMNFLQQDIFAGQNTSIVVSGIGANQPFSCLATTILPSHDLLQKAQSAPRYFYKSGRIDNVNDWAFEQFRARYEQDTKPKRAVTKDAIFHYVYGVLHDPIYREKYALNLKRQFPRIPFYANFWRWAGWGEKLMALHVGYEAIEPWPLECIDTHEEKSPKAGLAPKAMLRANKDAGNIQLDSETQLTGVPPKAWAYRLSNRSALEWILDQYKEKTPKDLTIPERFNTYRFAQHKEKVIDLIKRVTRVSVETMKIVEAMQAEKR